MPDDNARKSRYTEAQKKAAEKYLKESVEDIRIRVPRGQKEGYKAHANSQGESLNSFVIRAMNETIDRDKAPSQAPEPPQSENVSFY